MKTLLIALVLLVSCAVAVEGPETLEPPVGEVFTLRQIDTAKFEDLTLSISSIEDSRCPRDVVCYWAGEVKVTVEAESIEDKESFVLTAPPFTGPDNASIGKYKLTLLDVAPYPGDVVPTDTPTTVKLLLEEAQ